jgi:hypothetical protein
MSCSRCLAAHELESGELECRRHPPTVFFVPGGSEKISTWEYKFTDPRTFSLWPRVKPTDHCADHIHKV